MKQWIWLLLTPLLTVLNDSSGASSTKGGYRYQRIKVDRVWIVQLVLLVTIHWIIWFIPEGLSCRWRYPYLLNNRRLIGSNFKFHVISWIAGKILKTHEIKINIRSNCSVLLRIVCIVCALLKFERKFETYHKITPFNWFRLIQRRLENDIIAGRDQCESKGLI